MTSSGPSASAPILRWSSSSLTTTLNSTSTPNSLEIGGEGLIIDMVKALIMDMEKDDILAEDAGSHLNEQMIDKFVMSVHHLDVVFRRSHDPGHSISYYSHGPLCS